MSRRSRAVAAMVGVVVVFAACGGDPAINASGDSPEPDGAAVYAEGCASCHGADLRGTDRGPSLLSIVYEPNHHSDEAFRRSIVAGAPQHHWTFGDMAPVEGLSAAEVDELIGFVRTEQQRLGFEQ